MIIMGCPYKNLFGAPGTGAHSYRFMGVAVVDTVLTILVAWFSSWWVGGGTFFEYLILWFVLGEVLHYLFGAETAVIKMLGIPIQCSSTDD
jgi:hypothetical protein